MKNKENFILIKGTYHYTIKIKKEVSFFIKSKLQLILNEGKTNHVNTSKNYFFFLGIQIHNRYIGRFLGTPTPLIQQKKKQMSKTKSILEDTFKKREKIIRHSFVLFLKKNYLFFEKALSFDDYKQQIKRIFCSMTEKEI